ncbi:S-DNA-T family DNA segregation ATPase FtsK/SpoIIIE [Clostridium tetanomorphum]|uniref:DNA translocase FtsK n=1 Tax=Clostridium tetanomorphum TaxID=1553 RepID=A0A923EBS5_CLOTT|nr:DNA translocase FtsK [Clostridium tetanomorphum]KAJ51578.1 DNA translocase FtsK/SpoIIIE [Clostridium tetanomorphum DSM 665]MBC2398932.1 DNA translocase FtsK [Clostridium tetanomorphum]MBP1865227.1 S-DNA-T family DNA segregation ATPase FtsK/SpoIIIE [Clostridium tetanomorphum]NRS84634.1 S-DNA-T family DNA segregation ATPase FtsK/SpoIIIE [Clostridium tetanomorphum]NRZ97849.1 S-DNA-T family DNA segregation ATPase FtsK/SpoIIIE [Clostridium tetanomorphum]
MGRKKAKSNGDNDIKGIISITFGVLMLISVFSPLDSGIIGKIIKKILIATFGLGAFIFPFLIIFIGACFIVKKGKINFNKKFYGIVILLVNTLLCIQMGDIAIRDSNQTIFEGIKSIYNTDSILHGGIICYLIDLPLYKLFGKLGSFVIFIALYIISFILISQISLYTLIEKYKLQRNLRLSKKDIIQYDEIDSKELVAYDSNESEESKRNNKIKIIDFLKTSTLEKEEEIPNIEVQLSSENTKNKNIKEEEKRDINEELEKEIIKGTSNVSVEYKFPSLALLNPNIGCKLNKEDKKELLNNANKLEETLSSFGVEAKVIQVTKGPSVTRFELQPNAGVKVSKIVNLADDIALSLAASGVRIEAPIPGKSAVGIEVPNKDLTPVFLREVLESDQFSNFNKNIAFAIGKDIGGNCMVWDLAKMPHLLIAGATGSGKSVCINTLIISLLYKYSPENVKLLMVDPKVVELNIYNGIPHLLIPVVTDPKKAAGALNWAVNEMTRRYKLFAENNVRNVESYNELYEKGRIEDKLPLVVIIIDELADLMMVCPNDIEDYIGRLAQMARAAGMHLVIATQRPSVDVITGVIKANIPSRISFAVSSQIDSRTILDMSGAEKLLGKGDMLFYPTGEAKPMRIQGAFISEEEVEKVVEFIKSEQGQVEYENSIIEEINTSTEVNEEEKDELLEEAIKIVIQMDQASTSLLQRRLRIGYNRAARIIEQLEERGIISGKDGSKPRQVLINKEDV